MIPHCKVQYINYLCRYYVLNAQKVDPVTQCGLVPTLERLTHLEKLSIETLGFNPEQQDKDLEVLRSILATWTPSIPSRTLALEIWAQPQKKDMLEFMGTIGPIVEEHCSGM